MWRLVPYPSFAKNCVGQFIHNNDDDDSPIAPSLTANIQFAPNNIEQHCGNRLLADHSRYRPLGQPPDS